MTIEPPNEASTMTDKERTHLSKFLSLILRHEPGKVGLTLDEAGWVGVAELLGAMARHGHAVTRAALDEVVTTSDKKRFAFSADGERIRASQGHSMEVDLGYAPATPPDVLYHGTVERFLGSIRGQGLLKGQRHHVHLSADEATAVKVGDRRGRAVVLTIDAAGMAREGIEFYVSANGVWLTEHVPARFIAQ
jgi:putative RNA 2'-phosphotransferase